MRSIFVFDACTVINILRIDTENVLYEYLKSLDIHISSLVYKEIKKNIFKKNIDKESSERISTILPLIPSNFKVHNDDDTINVIGRNFFNKIKEYVKHQKKENGELMSSILSLQLSRAEDSSLFCYRRLPIEKAVPQLFQFGANWAITRFCGFVTNTSLE